MAENIARTGTLQVEIRMVRQIDHRVLVGGRGVVDLQLVGVGKAIRYGDAQVAGVAFLAILAEIAKLQASVRQYAGLPDALEEAVAAAVKRVFAVILGEFVLDAIERKPRGADAVPVTPNDRPEILRGIGEILRQGVEAKHHIGHPAVAAGRVQRHDDPGVIRDPRLELVLVGQSVDADSGAIRHLSEFRLGQFRRRVHGDGARDGDKGPDLPPDSALHIAQPPYYKPTV